MIALRNWHWSRWLRLGIGLAFIGQGIAIGEAFVITAGAFFSLQAILNDGCCVVESRMPARSTMSENDITYHEVK